jgi:uncharacterized protein with GYD domain
MALYMYQFSYTPESWAAQLKKPENRIENVGRALCEAAGGKLIGGWLCFGEYDAVLIADMPDAESWSAARLNSRRPRAELQRRDPEAWRRLSAGDGSDIWTRKRARHACERFSLRGKQRG